MPRCSFTMGQIEELLVVAHRIAPDRRSAFNGRLKHFQRLGFPTSERPGKGKAIRYTTEHLFRAVIAIELVQAGIPPKLAIDIVDTNWRLLLATTALNSVVEDGKSPFAEREGADWCWVVRPEALRELTEQGIQSTDAYENVLVVPAREIQTVLVVEASTVGREDIGAPWRNIVINGGPLVRGIMFLITYRFKWARWIDLANDLADASSDANELFKKAMDDFDLGIEDAANETKPPFYYLEQFGDQVEPAKRVIAEMTSTTAERFASAAGGSADMDSAMLHELIDLGVVLAQVHGIEMTPLGAVVAELLQSGGIDGEYS